MKNKGLKSRGSVKYWLSIVYEQVKEYSWPVIRYLWIIGIRCQHHRDVPANVGDLPAAGAQKNTLFFSTDAWMDESIYAHAFLSRKKKRAGKFWTRRYLCSSM